MSNNNRWVVEALAAGWIFWGFGYETVWPYYNLDLSGIIVSAQDVPPQGGPRHATRYVVRGDDGTNRIYSAGPTDASLDQDMPVGTRIQKVRGEFGFHRDGQWIPFPIIFYASMMGLSVVLAIAAVKMWFSDRRR